MIRRYSTRRAFTLIELLIVIAIILILIAIALPNFLEAQIRAKITRCKADMRTLSTAIVSYSIDEDGAFPYGQGSFRSLGAAGGYQPAAPLWVLTTPHEYLKPLPSNPFSMDPNLTAAEQDALLTFYYADRLFRRDQNWIDFTCPHCDEGWMGQWQRRGWREWVLFSPGPSNYNPIGFTGGFTYPDEVMYSATNGTKSIGGIFAGGPTGDGNALY